MNRIIIIFLLVLFSPLSSKSSGLVVKETPYKLNLYQPFYWITFEVPNTFVTIEDGKSGQLYHGSELIAEGLLTASKISNEKDGAIVITFDNSMTLPIGETYTLVIAKDLYRSVDDPDITNDEIRYEFEIPTYITEPQIKWGPVISSARSLGLMWWGVETEPLGEPKAYLYREDEFAGVYPLAVGFDWNLGQAYVDFGKTMYFDKDVNYTLIIPEGSVGAAFRHDIVNKEIVVNFTGGWEGQPDQRMLNYSSFWVNFYPDRSDIISKARFYFDEPIAFSTKKPVMRLFEETELLEESEATLTVEGGAWIVEAEFSDIKVKDKVWYIFTIPEGTIYTDDDEQVQNKELYHGVSREPYAHIDVEAADGTGFVVDGRVLSFDGLRAGAAISVVTIDGRMVMQTAAASESMSLTLPAAGLYIVGIDGKASKIAVR